jgi:hypothetical protein
VQIKLSAILLDRARGTTEETFWGLI